MSDDLPPALAALVDDGRRSDEITVRVLGGGGLVASTLLIGWIVSYVWQNDRLFEPREEEWIPVLAAAAVSLACGWLLRQLGRSEPLRVELARPGVRITWVALTPPVGPRGLPVVTLGTSSGLERSYTVLAGTRIAAMGRGREVVDEVVARWSPRYVGAGADVAGRWRAQPEL